MPVRYTVIKKRQEEAPPSFLERIFGKSKEEEAPKVASADQSMDKVPTPPEKKDEGMIPDWMQSLGAVVPRVAGPYVGALLGAGVGPIGAVAGGAAGGALGEYLGEKLEPGGLQKSASPARVAVNAAIGGVPGSVLVRAGKPLASAAAGGLFGYAGVAGNKLAEGEEPSKALNPAQWSGQEVLLGPVAGAGISSILGKIHKPTPQAPKDLTEKLVQEATSKPAGGPPTGPAGGVMTTAEGKQYRVGGIRVAPGLTRPGGELIKPATPSPSITIPNAEGPTIGSASVEGFTPEPPAVTEAKLRARVNALPPKSPLREGYASTLEAYDEAAAQRKLNETVRKAENKQQGLEDRADLQDTKTRLGGTNLSDINRKAEAGATAAQKLTQSEAAADTKLAADSFADQLKDLQNQADFASAQARAKEKIEQAAAQAAARGNKSATLEQIRDQRNLEQVMRWRKAQDDAKAAAIEAENAKAGLEKQPPSVVERTTSTEGPTKTTVTTRFAPPEPEEGGEGGDLGGGTPPNKEVQVVPNQHSKEQIAQTIYTSKEAAMRDAQATGADQVKEISEPGRKSKWRVVYNDLEQNDVLNRAKARLSEAGIPIERLSQLSAADADQFFKDVRAHRAANPESSFQNSVAEIAKRFKGPEEPPPPTAPAPAPKSPKGPKGPKAGPVALNPTTQKEVNRIHEEMQTFEYTPRTWNEVNRQGSTPEIKAGAAGAPVYDDIIAEGGSGTRSQVRAQAAKLLEGKVTKPNKTQQAILAVAEKRANGDTSVSKPWLPHVDDKLTAEVSDFTGGQPEHGVEAPVPNEDAGFDKFSQAVDELAAQDRAERETQPPVPTYRVEQVGQGRDKEFWVGHPNKEPIGPFKGKDAQKQAMQAMSQAQRADLAADTGVPKPPADQSPMTVQEFAQALSKEGEKPIAELPFTLDGGRTSKASTSAPPETSLLDVAEQPEAQVPNARLFKSRADALGNENPYGYKATAAAEKAGEVPKEDPFYAKDERGRPITPARMQGKELAQAKASLPKEAQPVFEQALNKQYTDFGDLAKLPPEEQASKLAEEVARWKSEKGEINPEIFLRAGLAGAGALAGAATTPDDPWVGALIGGSAGAFGPTIAKALIARVQMNQSMHPGTIELAANKIKDYTETFFKALPDYQRFALLTHPINLPINMWVGPYGSAVMASIEHILGNDMRGWEALKQLTPTNFGKMWYRSLQEAEFRIADAEERTEGQLAKSGPEWWKKLSAAPGSGMTAGDIAVRDILKNAGFSEQEARRITLTSEPRSSFGQGIAKLKKGAVTEEGKRSWLINMMLPFYRTATNQMENGFERAPLGLGMLYQKYAMDRPDPRNIQIAQQVITNIGVAPVSFAIGTVVPKEDSKYVVKFLNDFGGQYGNIAAAAFMAGQAYTAGRSEVGAVAARTLRDMPLPDTAVPAEIVSMGKALLEGNKELAPPWSTADEAKGKLKVGNTLLPGELNPNVPGSLPSVIGALTSSGSSSGLRVARPPLPPRVRYTPIKPKGK